MARGPSTNTRTLPPPAFAAARRAQRPIAASVAARMLSRSIAFGWAQARFVHADETRARGAPPRVSVEPPAVQELLFRDGRRALALLRDLGLRGLLRLRSGLCCFRFRRGLGAGFPGLALVEASRTAG